MRKILLAFGALMALSVSAKAQTVLSFPTWQAEDPAFAPWWKGVIADFESTHPGVKINMTSIAFNQYINQLTVRFAAGNPPDIVHLPSRNFAQFADKGWLDPLDDRLKTTDIQQNWNPLQSNMVWKGQTQGVLLMGYAYVLFYNKDMLKQAGLDVPATPDQLIAATKKITNKDQGIFGYGGVTIEHPNIVPEMSSWILGLGADPFKGGAYNFTDPAVIKAVDDYRQVLTLAPPGENSTQVRELFQNDKVAMMQDGPWQWAAYKAGGMKGELGMAPMPFTNMVGGMSNSLHMAAATDPKKKDLVWDFIKLAASPKWQEQYTILTSAPAARKGALTAATIAANPQLEVVNDTAAKAIDVFPQPDPVKADYNDYSTLVDRAVMRLFTSDDPTAKVLADLQADLQKKIPLGK